MITSIPIIIDNKEVIYVVGKGEIVINPIVDSKSTPTTTLRNVLHVLEFGYNLFSARVATKQNYSILMNDNKCTILDKDNKVVANANIHNDMYSLNTHIVKPSESFEHAYLAFDSLKLWHQRLGHINSNRIV